MSSYEATPTVATDAYATEAGAGNNERLQLVTFDVGGEEFAVDILAVQEINRMMQITRVPQSPDEVEGVINLRGKIIPVINLRSRFNMDSHAHGNESRIIVVEINDHTVGFTVDRVHEVLRIDRSIVEDAPSVVTCIDSGYIQGVGKLDDRLLILLDLDRLFDKDRLSEIAGSSQCGDNQAA